jgi:hypothetical protein
MEERNHHPEGNKQIKNFIIQMFGDLSFLSKTDEKSFNYLIYLRNCFNFLVSAQYFRYCKWIKESAHFNPRLRTMFHCVPADQCFATQVGKMNHFLEIIDKFENIWSCFLKCRKFLREIILNYIRLTWYFGP